MMMATQIISDLMMVMNMILGGSWWTTLGLFLTAHIYQQNMIATLMLNVLSHLAHFGMCNSSSPYLPLLLSICRYAFKYIQKGCDMTSFELQQQDEIKQWLDGRYISASEAAWRMFHFEMHDRTPNVICLQVHLPGQHMVVYNPEDSLEMVMDRAGSEQTTLTAFFAANADPGPLGAEAQKYTYQEFPQHFVYKLDK